MKSPVKPCEGLIPEFEEEVNKNLNMEQPPNELGAISSEYLKDINKLQELQLSFKTWASQEFEKRKVSRSDYDNFLELTNKFSEIVTKIETRTVTLNHLSASLCNNEKIQESINLIAESVQSLQRKNEKSFAEVVQLPRKVNQNQQKSTQVRKLQPKDPVVIIKPKNLDSSEKEASNIIKTKLAKGIPRESNIKVKNMKNVKDGGILIVLNSEEDKKKILDSNVIKSGQFKVSEPHNKQPKIIIYDVPSYVKEKEIPEIVFCKNSDCINLEKSEFIDGFKPVFKVGPKGQETVHWVILCSPKVRKCVINSNRLFIEWASCRVKDYVAAPRCYKCQNYGHVTKYCRNEANICAYCSASGHDIKQCNKKDGRPACSNCKKTGINFEHKANDPNCPCHLKALQLEISKTDYGYF